jgi:hypothetical protein
MAISKHLRRKLKRYASNSGYILNVHYSSWTEEDLEFGESSDQGDEIRNQHNEDLDDVVYELQNESWVSARINPNKKAISLSSDPEVDFRSGLTIVKSAFVSRKDKGKMTREDLSYLKNELRIR